MKKLLIPLLLSVATLAHAQYPSDFSIEKLQSDYIESKKCNGTCGLFTGLKLKSVDLSSRTLVFEIPVSASQLTTISLPFQLDNFNWVNFSIDGKKTQSVMAVSENIVVAIPQGSHIIEVVAKIKPEQFRVALVSNPKYFENNTSIKADVFQSGGKFFFEIENKKNTVEEVSSVSEKELEISKDIFDKPLYSIQREIFLSDKWRVRTTVSNFITVGNNKVTKISVPLLDGEKPLDSDLAIVDGKVNLSLSGNQVTWESNLTPKDKMVLHNTDTKNLETWTIYNENSWLYDYDGLNPVSTNSDEKYKSVNTWIMWPEEKVNLAFNLPKIAEGQESNVTDFHLTTNWESDPTEHVANFTINTSVGGRYVIKFEDKETEAIELKISDKVVETKIKDGILALDLLAGKNNVSIKFKSGKPSVMYKFPSLKFESSVTNTEFKINASKRWVMFTGGADIRPAVLVWGILIAFALLSWFLSKHTNTPLKFISWLLLLFGLSQTAWITSFVIIAWIVAFSLRESSIKKLKESGNLTDSKFNQIQTALGLLSVVGLITLISVVATGLISNPQVFTIGFNTIESNLSWYIQSWNGSENNPWILSLPMSTYRVLMLGWGIWLAFSLMTWLKWMWQEYSKDGYWKKSEEQAVKSDKKIESNEIERNDLNNTEI
jgi:hypothetical protein